MKAKTIVASLAAAVLGLALVASAAGYTFSNYLSVGSTGSAVSALQTWLIAQGFSIPAISSGAAQPGYFGSQTQAAVKLYQTSVGIPNTGFVGPLTVAALNKGETSGANMGSVSMGCPVGFTCTPVAPTNTTCPAGYTCSANPGTVNTGGSATSISTPGVAGTIAASLWTTPSGVTAYKGAAYDVVGYKLQAGSSDMAVTSISLDFNTRLWLYASSITLKDETGAVVGSVNNLNASNFAELTVGSDYRITIPVNFVVKATQAKYITANINFLAVTDRTSSTIDVTEMQVRSVDGTGVTDTETVGNGTVGSGNDRTFSYESTNIAQLVVTTDPSSPAAGVIQVSTAAQTMNVPLAIYDVKSQNQGATLQSLNIGLTFSSSTIPVGNVLSNVQISAGGLTYSASTLSTTTADFTNLQIPLPADTYVPVTVTATLAQDTANNYDGDSIYTTLDTTEAYGGGTNTGNSVPANLIAIDSTYNNIVSNAVTLTSNALAFSATGVNATNLAVNSSNVTANQGASSTETITFNYSLTAGNNPIYVSKTYATAVTATTTGTPGINFSLASFRDSDSTNDGSTYFYVSPGATKTFTAVVSAAGLPGHSGTYSITDLKYGTGTSGTGGDLNASTIANTLFSTVVF